METLVTGFNGMPRLSESHLFTSHGSLKGYVHQAPCAILGTSRKRTGGSLDIYRCLSNSTAIPRTMGCVDGASARHPMARRRMGEGQGDQSDLLGAAMMEKEDYFQSLTEDGSEFSTSPRWQPDYASFTMEQLHEHMSHKAPMSEIVLKH